jgi:diguanylate cyclase (GGDEF)-like protein
VKVLVADDDAVNRRILERLLEKWGYETVIAENGTEAWERLQAKESPRLVILDWMMPGMDGADICREVRKRGGPFYTYILMITARFQKQDVLQGLGAGADDYLTKPFESNELRARLQTGRRILELQEELVRSRDRLQYEASHDAMTGVWNHTAILEILQAELVRSEREALSVGVLLLDVDHFKKVNDRYGHLAGDAVLREVVRRLRTRLRAYDSIGRYGGEEFLLVLPNSNEENVLKQANRLRQTVSETPMDASGERTTVTISIGVAVFRREHQTQIEFVLKAADAALYRAKNGGRDRVEASWQASFPHEEISTPPDAAVNSHQA